MWALYNEKIRFELKRLFEKTITWTSTTHQCKKQTTHFVIIAYYVQQRWTVEINNFSWEHTANVLYMKLCFLFFIHIILEILACLFQFSLFHAMCFSKVSISEMLGWSIAVWTVRLACFGMVYHSSSFAVPVMWSISTSSHASVVEHLHDKVKICCQMCVCVFVKQCLRRSHIMCCCFGPFFVKSRAMLAWLCVTFFMFDDHTAHFAASSCVIVLTSVWNLRV